MALMTISMLDQIVSEIVVESRLVDFHCLILSYSAPCVFSVVDRSSNKNQYKLATDTLNLGVLTVLQI